MMLWRYQIKSAAKVLVGFLSLNLKYMIIKITLPIACSVSVLSCCNNIKSLIQSASPAGMGRGKGNIEQNNLLVKALIIFQLNRTIL